MPAETVEVRDNPEASRFEIHFDGNLAGFSAYIVRPTRLVFTHTEVDEALEGRGLGSKLAQGALDDVRRRGLRITPRCPFIAAYIRRHPEYADLVDMPV
ncbi:MAG TPA: GNAT family N-acetyltransferase [Candidatus Limnocylindria bacterium]|nr:GNAT family N-acetyltransferase [Candidatus Limnocylindria bacterium]